MDSYFAYLVVIFILKWLTIGISVNQVLVIISIIIAIVITIISRTRFAYKKHQLKGKIQY